MGIVLSQPVPSPQYNLSSRRAPSVDMGSEESGLPCAGKQSMEREEKISSQSQWLHEFGAGVFVCVFFPFVLDIKFVGRTSRGHIGGRSHRISHPPSFCGACLNFSREKDSAIPFPRRP